MNLIEFANIFPNEEACIEHFRKKREATGISCKRCAGAKHYWLKGIHKWECANCRSRTNLKSGTMLEKSKLPVRIWYLAIHLMTSVKKDFSAKEMQRQLGWKRYEPIWYMMQKIRTSMGKRDSNYSLKGEIEMDDAFFIVVDLERDDDEPLKRGRGSQRQAQVLVMVESQPNPKQKKEYKKNRVMGYVKMLVMHELKTGDINQETELALSPDATVLTDGYRAYARLQEVIKKHIPMKIPPTEAHKKLPWVHTMIANAKRGLLGIHHSIGAEYLQNYLNEFCYKVNRRNFTSDLFDRMIVAGVSDTWY
jgi:hypothetical protein